MDSLSASQREFILHWGEMSSRWGINRSVAQIHALLYVTDEPLTAEQLTEQLSLARSNVSTSLRELQAWGVVRVTHRLGDRRDYFQAVADVWEMFQTILAQRKRREIDPTVEMLRECLARHEASHGEDTFAHGRMRDLLELLEQLVGLYEQMSRLSPQTQRKVLKMRSKIGKIIGEIGPGKEQAVTLSSPPQGDSMRTNAAVDRVAVRGVSLSAAAWAELRTDSRAIEKDLAAMIASPTTRIDEVSRHALLAGGKRARPLLTCAIMRALGADPAPHIEVVTAAELAHTGSLLHDDIIDEAQTRRGRRAAHLAFDVPTAILSGDKLVVLALERVARNGSGRLVVALCGAVRALCDGVSLERERLYDATVDLAHARNVNRLKTASLFAYAAEAGAILSGADARLRAAARCFGSALGEAFQTTDDLLDFQGDPGRLGKGVGQDLTTGAVTVPLAIALERAPSLGEEVFALWESAADGAVAAAQLRAIRERMDEVGALAEAQRIAVADAVRAVESIRALGSSPWHERLVALTWGVVKRQR